MEEALRTVLLGTAPLTSHVERRIGWGLRSQGDPLPAVTLTLISSVAGLMMTGSSGWTRARVQADVWGRTYKDARDAAREIAGRSGVLNGARVTVERVRLRTFIQAQRTLDTRDAEGPLFRQSIDVTVWHDA